MEPKSLKTYEIILLILVIAGGGWWFARKQAPVTVSPMPTATASATPASVDTSDWLTYANPTYNITMKYPAFYSETKRTQAYEAYSKGVANSQMNTPPPTDELLVKVLLRKLDGITYSPNSLGYSSQLRYSASTNSWSVLSKQDGYVEAPSDPEIIKEYAPIEYKTSMGMHAWVAHASYAFYAKFDLGAYTQTAYVESPDGKYVFELVLMQNTTAECDNQRGSAPCPQATDQTIYQILDTLEIKQPTSATGEVITLNGVYAIYAQKESVTFPIAREYAGDYSWYYLPITIPKTQNVLNAVLYEMIERQPETFQCGKYKCVNELTNKGVYRENLHFEKATVVNGTASIYLKGELIPIGDLDDSPSIIELVAKQFSSVKEVNIYLNGKILEWSPMG